MKVNLSILALVAVALGSCSAGGTDKSKNNAQSVSEESTVKILHSKRSKQTSTAPQICTFRTT